MNLIIYGCGRLGQYIFRQLRDSNTISVVAWIDNYSHNKCFEGLPVYSEDEYMAKLTRQENDVSESFLIAIMNTEAAQKAAMRIHSHELNVFMVHNCMMDSYLPIVNEDGNFNAYFVKKFEDVIPVLPYMEYQVADKCNLNCKACMHFSNLVEKQRFAELDDFEDSLSVLSRKFSDIKTIRLMGGEPLLNPQLSEFAYVARQKFPKSDIRIVTNGILIRQIPDKLIRVLRNHCIILDITQYPPIRKMTGEMLAFMDDNQLRYILSAPVEEFIIRGSDGSNPPKDVFENACLSRMCTFLRNKKLYVCPHIPMLYECQTFFGFEILDTEFERNAIDIFDNKISGWDILRRFETPFSMCRFCSEFPKKIKWNLGQPYKDDWIVEQ